MSGCCGQVHYDQEGYTGSKGAGAIVLKVKGMECGHCQMRVEKALKSVPGVERVNVDFTGKQALVTGVVDRSSLIDAIEDVGYSVLD